MVSFKALTAIAAALFGAVTAAPAPRDGDVIEGNYIVTLKSGISQSDVESHINWVGDVHRRSLGRRDLKGVQRTFDSANYDFHGYSGEFDAETIEEIQKNPNVANVEEDKVIEIDYIQESGGPSLGKRLSNLGKRAIETQDPAPWGLTTLTNPGPDEGSAYVYDSEGGAGTYAYVIDSGINDAHNDFSGRASRVWTAFPDESDDDGRGHGTHVAATIGGTKYGVAKQASLLSVKVFSGTSPSSVAIVIDGLNWAVNDIVSKGRQNSAVVNMSLSGGFSAALNDAVTAANDAGVVVVVIAGNDGGSAYYYSPASAKGAFTVGAINSTWHISTFSNHGPELIIFAPGTAIESAWIGGPDAINTISGTSMAAPHVAGLVLHAFSREGITGTEAMRSFLKTNGTPDKVQGYMWNTDNLVLNNGLSA